MADLSAEDLVVSHGAGDGLADFLRVKSVVLEDERQDTYNFEVADTHTYFVGKLNAWVHNACDPGDILQGGGKRLDDNTLISVHGDKLEELPDGTYENVGPASAEETQLSGVVVEVRSAKLNGGFEGLASFRNELDLPEAGTPTDKSTLAVLELDGEQIYGINAHGQRVTGVNAISATHAEIDVLKQVSDSGVDVSGRELFLYVDRTPCTACSRNGGCVRW